MKLGNAAAPVSDDFKDESEAEEGEGGERDQHDKPPLQLVIEVRNKALGGRDIDVEVEGGEEREHCAHEGGPVDVGAGEQRQHLEVVPTDRDEGDVEVLFLKEPAADTECDHRADEHPHKQPRVLRALLALAVEAEVTLRKPCIALL